MKRMKKNGLRNLRKFVKEKHDGFACGGNGEIRTDVDGWYDDHSKCSPLLLNECYFKKKTWVLKGTVSTVN